MTFGYSRDDAEGGFLLKYVEDGILPVNPFQTLDDAVAGLMKIAVDKGRATQPGPRARDLRRARRRPGVDPKCERIGLDYVSCSPFRVPVARLAAARASIAADRARRSSTDAGTERPFTDSRTGGRRHARPSQAASRRGGSEMNYIDGFVAAVPTADREKYRAHAAVAAEVFKQHGALKLVECWGDDVPTGKTTSFPQAVKLEPNKTVVFSWVAWPYTPSARRRHEESHGRPANEKSKRCRSTASE